jgi:hypothetical protein
MDLTAKIAKLEAALNDPATTPAKYSSLAMRLATLVAAKKDADDDEEDEDDEEEKKAKKAKQEKAEKDKVAAAATEAKPAAKHAAEDDEESKKAKSALALIETVTGRKGDAALGAAAALFSRVEEAIATTARLEKSAEATERTQLLESVARHGTHKGMGAWLATQPIAVLRGFAEQALKGPKAVATEEGDLLIPNATKANTKDSLPKEIQEMITSAVSVFPSSLGADAKVKFEAELVRRHLEDQAKALNGAGKTY